MADAAEGRHDSRKNRRRTPGGGFSLRLVFLKRAIGKRSGAQTRGDGPLHGADNGLPLPGYLSGAAGAAALAASF